MVFVADFAFKVPAELETALRLNSVHHYVTKRPWLGKLLCLLHYVFLVFNIIALCRLFMFSYCSDLYGVNVRPVAPFGSMSRKPNVDPSLLHRYLPDELLFEVLT